MILAFVPLIADVGTYPKVIPVGRQHRHLIVVAPNETSRPSQHAMGQAEATHDGQAINARITATLSKIKIHDNM